MIIGSFDTSERVLIVAEAGNNHEGDFDVASELVRQAAACGADAIKFQTFKTDHYVGRSDEARFNRLKSFELTYDEFAALSREARALGLLFLSTPFDLASCAALEPLVDAYKIASGDNDFFPLIERVMMTRKPVILSTGLSDLNGVARSVAFMRALGGGAGLALLHCVAAYPVAPEQANLRAITSLRDTFNCDVGYSDHTIGNDAAVLAVAQGAVIVEKHFTLDKHQSDFRDHQLSADPADLRDLVRRVQEASAMLGSGDKRLQPCETAGVVTMRRSIVAARELGSGHRIEAGDLTWVRPGGGLRPGEEGRLVGKVLRRDVPLGDRLQDTDVEGS